MIRLSALNENSEVESHSEGEVTKEALEQIALREYAKALDLHRKGNLSDATQLLKDLLDTELLSTIKKPAQGEKITGPLFNMKYLCYKNLAFMLSASGEIEGAIEAYCSASELDDTDVTLWHRLGLLCLRSEHYERALNAFQRGVELNPKHWPCLDKIVTLLLGLGYKEDCISTIYDTLQLDPGYLRGLVYRRHVYLNYPYIRDFMEYLNPIYKWNEIDDDLIDEEQCRKLLKEAEDIHKSYLEQQKAEQFKYCLPNLKLKKPIRKFTWESVGESLIHMHHHMAENYYSHACPIEIVIDKEENEEVIEVCEESKDNELANNDKSIKSLSENDNIDMFDKDKETVNKEKDYVENLVNEPGEENPPEPKRKAPVRRKGGDLSFLKQWEWCTKRRSSRKKHAHENDCLDDNIYNTLQKMMPIYLLPKNQGNEEEKEDIITLSSMFEIHDQANRELDEKYFGFEKEHKDVELFINKYTENKRDIIDILNDYLSVLADKWRVKWPENLSKIFIQANKCYNNHIDVPSCTDSNHQELLHYMTVNLLIEEFTVNEKLKLRTEDKQPHDSNVIECIGMALTLKPHILSGTNILEFMLRYLWVKLHINLLQKSEELCLDCLYQLSSELEAIGEHHGIYFLEVVNFTFKPVINKEEISLYIKFLETNKRLSTVMNLYKKGCYEEVLPIILNSFDYCKDLASEQDKEVSLDFAVQLSLILDVYWALENVDTCFKWSFICLHEALKHYFRYTPGSKDYNKWTLTVVKILCCVEHILTTEGVSCLETISQKDLSQGLEDLIRIIVHQVETNSSELLLDNVTPWIILHYILQREEDQGRGRTENSEVTSDNVPSSLMLLFIAHEKLGSRGWCGKSEGKLLYFILDTIVPRLRSPSLSRCLKIICQHIEQCVYCLFKHPGKINKLKYLVDHNVTAHSLDWTRAQQVYEIFRPPTLPALEGKISGITADTVLLFQRILELIPLECDPRKYVSDMEKYVRGEESKLPTIPPLLPYKIKDIYFLLGDYYFKKEDRKMAIEFNMLDVIVNNDRLESWAEISLAKALNLQHVLNSCENLNKERDILTPAICIIRCFERTLKLDPTYCSLWTEYGIFVYTVHSFCSRILKQTSESLSMDDFAFLDKQKEDMLCATQKCFMEVLRYMNNNMDSDKGNEDAWIPYYMLGKVAEKRNKPPSVYLNYYIQSLKSLEETNATYPLKINYNSPTKLCIEVLELHYRIHASILKYLEQHEDKHIPLTVGKVFSTCIKVWNKCPFAKKLKKDSTIDMYSEEKIKETVNVANMLKRTVSEIGKDDEYKQKRLKLESAAVTGSKSVSPDIETLTNINQPTQNESLITEAIKILNKDEMMQNNQEPSVIDLEFRNNAEAKNNNERTLSTDKLSDKVEVEKEDEGSSSVSSSSSDSSSSESSSDENDGSGRDSDTSSKTNNSEILPQEEIMEIASACLDALEDCASRFPPHYKAIYRLAHYYFYYKKGKDTKRCRDLMLSIFISRSGQKLGGIFSERKSLNFFNNIWKIPSIEVDRAGSFSFHMNRSVLLAMEISKETDDHKTLLDLGLYLQRLPEPDKKYLKDSDREELAQQALCLCCQSFKSQLLRFSLQTNLNSNDAERQRLNSLILDIYRAYQKTQKMRNAKQFINLLIDAYKLATTAAITENMNLVDISMKYCQALKSAQKKQTTQITETANATTSLDTSLKPETKKPSVSTSKLAKISPREQSVTFQSISPKLNEQELVRQTTSTIAPPTWINLKTIADLNQTNLQTIQSKLQSPPPNPFESKFSHKSIAQSFPSFNIPPPKKQKFGPKITNTTKSAPVTKTYQMKPSKSFSGMTKQSVSKAPTSAVSHLQRSSSMSSAPSMGTVLSTLPPSMAANLAALGTSVHASLSAKRHLPSTSTMNASINTKPPLMQQQVNYGKMLQNKLTERHKKFPSISNRWKDNVNASISKLPSSVTVTKTSVPKQSGTQLKKGNAKSLPLLGDRGVIKAKQTSSNEVIVLDD